MLTKSSKTLTKNRFSNLFPFWFASACNNAIPCHRTVPRTALCKIKTSPCLFSLMRSRSENIQTQPAVSIRSYPFLIKREKKRRKENWGIFAFFDNFCRPNKLQGDATLSSTDGSTTVTECHIALPSA